MVMLIIFDIMIMILGFVALANISLTSGNRALSVCSNIALAFIKSAQLLFGECIISLISIICIVFASSNHFVLDSYITFYFSSLILVIYHIIQTSKYPLAAI